eukprot:15011984-Heterocapsa_arctica.AAC.1
MATRAAPHHCSYWQRWGRKRRTTQTYCHSPVCLQSVDGSKKDQSQTMGDEAQRWQIYLTRDPGLGNCGQRRTGQDQRKVFLGSIH